VAFLRLRGLVARRQIVQSMPMDENLKTAIIEAVIALAQKARAGITIGAKYGGMVFLTDPDAPEAAGLAGGVFGYKDHVSVEFSKGAQFQDPTGLLEGKGKMRRHVKLRSLGDIEDKDVAGFLAQALA
jgi:hypothetical protein